MSNQWQARRGTTAQNDAFTGASGEITYDTDSQGLRIHDGTKQGGYLIDTVVDFQKPTAENNYTWYRLYASGFVEQGGICPSLGYTVTFPVAMADVNYTALGTARNTSGNYAIRVEDITTTGMKLNSSSSNQHTIWWQVSGMAA